MRVGFELRSVSPSQSLESHKSLRRQSARSHPSRSRLSPRVLWLLWKWPAAEDILQQSKSCAFERSLHGILKKGCQNSWSFVERNYETDSGFWQHSDNEWPSQSSLQRCKNSCLFWAAHFLQRTNSLQTSAARNWNCGEVCSFSQAIHLNLEQGLERLFHEPFTNELLVIYLGFYLKDIENVF